MALLYNKNDSTNLRMYREGLFIEFPSIPAGAGSQVRFSEGPAALHHPGAGRTVTVVGQLRQARQQAVVRQLVLAVEGIWGGGG